MSAIIEISHLDMPQLDVFARLTEAQLRSRQEPEKGIFIAEGLTVIGHAMDAGCLPVSFLMERKHITGKARDVLSRCDAVPVYTADSSVLEELTGFPLTRGVLCAMRRPASSSADSVLQDARRIAILEDIVDPTNLGAIFRCAAALGMDGILLTPSCCDPLNRRSIRVSMGTVFQIPWSRIPAGQWPHSALESLHLLGFQTAAMALRKDAVSVDDPALHSADKLAVILGSEGPGLCAETIAACDYSVMIPMTHGVDSLNVAAASAVAFWELRAR